MTSSMYHFRVLAPTSNIDAQFPLINPSSMFIICFYQCGIFKTANSALQFITDLEIDIILYKILIITTFRVRYADDIKCNSIDCLYFFLHMGCLIRNVLKYFWNCSVLNSMWNKYKSFFNFLILTNDHLKVKRKCEVVNFLWHFNSLFNK